jgi:hypothetical protein
LVIGLIVLCIVITLIIYIISQMDLDLSFETTRNLGFSFLFLIVFFLIALRILIPMERGRMFRRELPERVSSSRPRRDQGPPSSEARMDSSTVVENIMARQDWTTPPTEDGFEMGYSDLGGHMEVVAHVGDAEEGAVTIWVLPQQVIVVKDGGPNGSDDEISQRRTIDIPITMEPKGAKAEILGELVIVSAPKGVPTQDRDPQMVKLKPMIKG